MITGGLRFRLVQDSFTHMLRSALTDLGWFATGRQHRPLQLVVGDVDETTVRPNTMSVTFLNLMGQEQELGSTLAEHEWDVYVDLYAEHHTLGLHLIGDVRDILEGRMPLIGRERPAFQVYDWRTDPPPELFWCGIEAVEVARTMTTSSEWKWHWFSCACVVVDQYA